MKIHGPWSLRASKGGKKMTLRQQNSTRFPHDNDVHVCENFSEGSAKVIYSKIKKNSMRK